MLAGGLVAGDCCTQVVGGTVLGTTNVVLLVADEQAEKIDVASKSETVAAANFRPP
jgi:hypothetical protein